VETRREPLFRDPFARAFLSRPLRLLVQLAEIRALRTSLERYADRRAPGARSSAICRTRFIDDFVRAEALDGARQLVILGAGFDCRAHRLVELDGSRVFEVDRVETQARKRAILLTRAGTKDVTYVEVDFKKDDLGKRLAASGWMPSARTTFIWEGVTNYLNEEAVAAVLDFLGHAAPKSAMVFTYIHRGVLDGTKHFAGAELLMKNVARLGEPWTFGIEPTKLGGFVERFGLRLENNLGADEYRTRYGWSADLHGYGFYRIAVARV
jgi:methyltransferase (TIGR00027 family)